MKVSKRKIKILPYKDRLKLISCDSEKFPQEAFALAKDFPTRDQAELERKVVENITYFNTRDFSNFCLLENVNVVNIAELLLEKDQMSDLYLSSLFRNMLSYRDMQREMSIKNNSDVVKVSNICIELFIKYIDKNILTINIYTMANMASILKCPDINFSDLTSSCLRHMEHPEIQIIINNIKNNPIVPQCVKDSIKSYEVVDDILT